MEIQIWLSAFAFVFALMNLVFIIAAVLKKNDLADVAWGPGFVLAGFGAWAGSSEVLTVETHPRFFLVLALVTLWALRLAVALGSRNLSSLKEDSRYNTWRKEWGNTWLWRTYLQVFTLQSLILIVVAAPLIFLAGSLPHTLDGISLAGIVVWILGFLFESISDYQLAQFKKNPQNHGHLMTSGLWSWSRHPNYFGEVTLWWGIFLIGLSLPGAWVTLLSPVAITFLILKVSGVSMLEAQMKNRPGFEEYKKRTSEFFPLPPRGGRMVP